MIQSEVTAYLDLPRWWDRGYGCPSLDTDELVELIAMRPRLLAMSRADRGDAINRLANRFGVSERTIYRYLRKAADAQLVRVGDYVAIYVVRDGEPPCQATRWSRAR